MEKQKTTTNESNLTQTKYGLVFIVSEDGQKKVNFKKSKFKSMLDFIGFLNDKKLTSQLLGY